MADDPYTVVPGVQPQSPPGPHVGRGRPPRYPWRQLEYVGDHFVVRGKTRPQVQATGENFITKSGQRGVVEFAYLRVPGDGVLVTVVRSPGGRSRYEVDARDWEE